jgi:hypothetical protein
LARCQSIHRARRVLALDVKRRALVERERDVRAERGLHLHRGLRSHEARAAVGVGAEAHALLIDRQDAAIARTAATLDLVGHRAVTHREHLEAPRVRDDRPPPAHELVQPAHARDVFVPGPDEEVEGVAEHHLVAERRHLRRVQRLDRRARGQRDEGRRVNLAVRRNENARSGGAVAGVDPE